MSDSTYTPLADWMVEVISGTPRAANHKGRDRNVLAERIASEVRSRPGQWLDILEMTPASASSFRQVLKAAGIDVHTTASSGRPHRRVVRAGWRVPPRPPTHSAMRLFTPAEVIAMREEYEAGGTSQLKLAARHGVDKTSILSILRGRSYRDVGGPLAPPASSSTALDEATIAKLEKYEMAVALGLIED